MTGNSESTDRPWSLARRIRGAFGILVLSAMLFAGCGDKTAPTQPQFPTVHPTVTPTATSLPVVTSAEQTTKYYGNGWIIRGANLFPDPVGTFEAGGIVITLSVEEDTFSGEYIGVNVPPGTAPGSYTPCVSTKYGKGCGNFTVTVK